MDQNIKAKKIYQSIKQFSQTTYQFGKGAGAGAANEAAESMLEKTYLYLKTMLSTPIFDSAESQAQNDETISPELTRKLLSFTHTLDMFGGECLAAAYAIMKITNFLPEDQVTERSLKAYGLDNLQSLGKIIEVFEADYKNFMASHHSDNMSSACALSKADLELWINPVMDTVRRVKLEFNRTIGKEIGSIQL